MANANGSTLAAPLRTSGVHPRAHGGNPFLWDRGRFRRSDTDRMLQDAQTLYVLRVASAPVFAAQVEVESRDARVQEYVARQFRTLWDVHLPRALFYALSRGHCGGEVAARVQGGYLEIGPANMGYWQAWRPFLEGGEVAGVNVHDQADGESIELREPGRWFWLTNGGEDVWGWPIIAGMWRAWVRKTGPKGLEDAEALYAFRHAFTGDVLYRPNGVTKVGGVDVDNAAIAADILSRRENGSSTEFDGAVDEVTGKRLWELIVGEAKGSPAFMADYGAKLDKEYFKGAGIPSEVVEAAETGSGWAGRTVPFLIFLKGADQVVGGIVRAWDAQLVRPYVRQNYGDVPYEVKPKSLVPADEPPDQKGKSQSGTGKPEGDGGTMPLQQPEGQRQSPPALLSADASAAPAPGA